MSEPRPLTAREVVGGGLRIVFRFVRARPWAFTLAVTGAALFAGANIASSAVISPTTSATGGPTPIEQR